MIGDHPLVVVVGSGGVGKTTLAAALGLEAARAGRDTLVMTFDPSHRLKDALGVGEAAREREVAVDLSSLPKPRPTGSLAASLLDARTTFDRLIDRYAPDPEARRRILENRYYAHLSGTLAGILEYMAVERLFEVNAEGRYQQIILDTPPTRQALDFLEAPARIVGFLDSSILRAALRPWFDEAGRLKYASWGPLRRRIEGLLDRLVGLDFLRDMVEFFQAFSPLYAGFYERAQKVEQLLRSPRTQFVLVTGPGEERIPDTLFFARKLAETGHHLGPVVVNRVHPVLPPGAYAATRQDTRRSAAGGLELLSWLGERDHRGLAHLRQLLGPNQPVIEVPVLADEPTNLTALADFGRRLGQ